MNTKMLSTVSKNQSSTMKFPNYNEFRASSRRQIFSIPESIVFYMAKNPTYATLYQKMVETCKYFFIQNPIIFLHCLKYHDEDGWETCVHDEICAADSNNFCKIKIENIKSNICVSNRLSVHSSTSSIFATSFFPKLCNGGIASLELYNQDISFYDLLFFSKTIHKCFLSCSTVFDENGEVIPLEKVIANLPNLDYFFIEFPPEIYYDFSNTVTELLKTPHFEYLTDFNLCGINESLDIRKLFYFLKKNKYTQMFITYDDEIVSEEYKHKLQSITDEILDPESSREYIPPYIEFIGQLFGDELYELYNPENKNSTSKSVFR